MNGKKKHLIISSLFCLLPFIFFIALKDKLPSKIPMQWNLQGGVNNWMETKYLTYLFPLLFFCINIFNYFRQKDEDSVFKIYITPIISIFLSVLIIGGSILFYTK